MVAIKSLCCCSVCGGGKQTTPQSHFTQYHVLADILFFSRGMQLFCNFRSHLTRKIHRSKVYTSPFFSFGKNLVSFKESSFRGQNRTHSILVHKSRSKVVVPFSSSSSQSHCSNISCWLCVPCSLLLPPNLSPFRPAWVDGGCCCCCCLGARALVSHRTERARADEQKGNKIDI